MPSLHTLRIALLALGLAGCGHTLFTGELKNQGDSWTITLTDLSDGPNTYTHGQTIFFPERGGMFLWAHLVFVNNASQKRHFSFDACTLDFGQHAIAPRLVSYSKIATNSLMSHETDFSAGEDKERYLVFVYPVEYYPRRLTCAGIPLDLPPLPSR